MEPIEPKTASRRLYSSLDIHKAVFDGPPARRSIEDLDAGILSHRRRTHARRRQLPGLRPRQGLDNAGLPPTMEIPDDA